MQFAVCVMCGFEFASCAAFSLCYVRFLVSVSGVQFAVTGLVDSLRACLASLGRAYACVHIFEAGQNESWCEDLLGQTFVEATDKIPPYIHICIYIYIYMF